MAAQMKQGRTPSFQLVARKEYLKVVKGCKNPPKASKELKEFVAKARALKA